MIFSKRDEREETVLWTVLASSQVAGRVRIAGTTSMPGSMTLPLGDGLG
ncbi:hypothetical protein ACFSKL_06895 [Belliella marina]|uniref:Uncharacterized protein n=1 Tax=Belliella marina TaxID=1644146 RepID=A0ABW4VKV5_9BACT